MDLLVAAPFTPPADGPVPFRRDRIPLEAGVMEKLSRQLVTVAKSLDANKPEARRGQAQMLALALALSPGNANARETIRYFEKNTPKVDSLDEPEKMIERFHQLMTWLDDEAAGSDAAALGVCLRDVMRHFDPKHPFYDDPWDQGEYGQWAGWVPGIDAYQKKEVKVSLPKSDEVVVPTPPEPQPTPPTQPTPLKPGKFALTLPEVEIMTPIWRLVGQKPSQGWNFKMSPLRATATYPGSEEGEAFALQIGDPGGPIDFNSLQNKLEQILRGHHRQLPQRLRVVVNGQEFRESLSSQKDQSISAIPATLCSAIITGRKPVARVIGTVSWDRKIRPGLNFWGKLKSLEKGQGQRLVVSSDCEPYMQAKLTMHAVDFFLEHEVMYASNYEQLLDRALEGGSEPVSSASQKFKLIQEVSKGQNILRYVSNVHVKKRLMEVLEQDPNHVSARLLLQQANNGRANSISREMAAAEISWILEPVFQVAAIPYYTIGNSDNPMPDVGSMEKTIRSQLDDLQIYLDRADRDWAARAGKAASGLRDLERALSNRDEVAKSQEVYMAIEKLNDSLRALKRELEDARGERKD